MKTSSMGICGNPGGQDVRDSALCTGFNQGNTFCLTNLPIGVNKNGTADYGDGCFLGTPGAAIQAPTSTAGASVLFRKSTLPPCTSSPAGSI